MADRTGSVGRYRGRWRARVTFMDPVTGKRRDIRQVAKPNTKARACDIRDALLLELETSGPTGLDRSVRTFAQLAQHFTETHATPPEFRDGRQISGMRSWVTARAHTAKLVEFFGGTPIKSITVDDLRRCRLWLLDQPIEYRNREGRITKSRPRSIATVNREMSILRRILNVAQQNRWIVWNPFNQVSRTRGIGETLIPTSDEKNRDRVLSAEEEKRLLAVCVAPRDHLRAVVITALDTGMRRGEILQLRWSDIDLETKTIVIREEHTKTLRSRVVGITERLADELTALRKSQSPTFDEEIFPVASVKRAFATALREAKIHDFKFHDIRHTAATRMIQSGLSLVEVARILGHATPSRVTYRYTNLDDRTVERGRTALDEWQKVNANGKKSGEVLVFAQPKKPGGHSPTT